MVTQEGWYPDFVLRNRVEDRRDSPWLSHPYCSGRSFGGWLVHYILERYNHTGHLGTRQGESFAMELEITTDRVDDVCTMTLQGEVDVYTAPRLKEALLELIESGCVRILVDLDGVGFIDSSGLGVLVGGLRRAKERDGAIRLVCTRESVLKIFRITGLDKVFAIFPEAAEARDF